MKGRHDRLDLVLVPFCVKGETAWFANVFSTIFTAGDDTWVGYIFLCESDDGIPLTAFCDPVFLVIRTTGGSFERDGSAEGRSIYGKVLFVRVREPIRLHTVIFNVFACEWYEFYFVLWSKWTFCKGLERKFEGVIFVGQPTSRVEGARGGDG